MTYCFLILSNYFHKSFITSLIDEQNNGFILSEEQTEIVYLSTLSTLDTLMWECETLKSVWGHTLSLSIKAVLLGLLCCRIWMKWKLTLTFHLIDRIPPTLKHNHVWVVSIHLVCEPTHLMRVRLRKLWHCNKQPVWCVCLIIPPFQLSGSAACKHQQRTLKSLQMENIYPFMNLCLQSAKKNKMFIELALGVMNNVALQW